MVRCGLLVRRVPKGRPFQRASSNSAKLDDSRRGGVLRRKSIPDVFTNTKFLDSRAGDYPTTAVGFQALLDASTEDQTGKQTSKSTGEDWNIAGVELGLPRRSRRYGNPSLPLPLLSLQKQEKHRRRVESTRNKKAALYDKHATIKSNMKSAPFNTAFLQNPYARALAAPVRMCQLTMMRMPTSCMMDLRLVTDPKTNKPTLLPTSPILAAISSNKKPEKYNAEEKFAYEKEKEDQEFTPSGAASYVVSQSSAIEYMGQKPVRWQHQLNLRMRNTLQLQGLAPRDVLWRQDLPTYILSLLRQAVFKKLRPLLFNKGSKDKPGLVCAIPGIESLNRLAHVSDVACVLQLGPEGAERVAKLPPDGKRLGPDSGDSAFTNQSDTKHPAEGWWMEEERRKSLPIVDLKPLPPTDTPSALNFATVAYRNRQVPVYNLLRMLGSPMIGKLLTDTVFKDCKYITVQMNKGTSFLQVWLMKLGAYVSDGVPTEIPSESLPSVISTATRGPQIPG